MKVVADTLGVARSNLHDKVRRAAKPRGANRKRVHRIMQRHALLLERHTGRREGASTMVRSW
jgi:hypothetical protein